MHGYNGKILRVNLTSKAISIENPGEEFYRKYFGGRNLIAYYLLKELEPGIDPLGPKNKLIFATGVLTGGPFAGSARHSIGAKSPLTGYYGDGEAGGSWGWALKKAGFDAIIVEGKAVCPVYLLIDSGEVEIKDAAGLWGKTTGAVQKKLQQHLGTEIHVAQIGPAGENLVKYASIIHDLNHVVGRTGMGAVMGSKNLKAVVVKGGKFPEFHDAEALKKVASYMTSNYKKLAAPVVEFGTLNVLPGLNAGGGLPTRNFQEGAFDGADKISGIALHERFVSGKDGCYRCPIACKRKIARNEDLTLEGEYGGPEYETVAAFGSNCGIDSLPIIIKAHELCNSLGLDTISTGVTISFVLECFERGLLSAANCDGLELQFGNHSILELIPKIAYREGFGNLMAEGSRSLAKHIGNDALAFAVQIKGQEVPLHEPRLKQGLGLGYAVSPTGADHTQNLHDPMYEKEGGPLNQLKALGYYEPLPARELSPRKARLFIYGSAYRYLANCLVTCFFVPWQFNQLSEIVRSMTGWNTTAFELMKIMERSINLTRCFNLREGLEASEDDICSRFAEPFKNGPLAGVNVDPEKLAGSKLAYYRMMGWTDSGIPTPEKLLELGLEWLEPVVRG